MGGKGFSESRRVVNSQFMVHFWYPCSESINVSSNKWSVFNPFFLKLEVMFRAGQSCLCVHVV